METIYVTGDIDEAAFKRFDMKLTRLESDSCSDTKAYEIRVVLSSGGGSAYDALAFHDRIKHSPLYARVECYGTAFSAAVIILAAGDMRFMGANAWAMVHEDVTDVTKHDKVSNAEKSLGHSRRLETQWCSILEKDTGTKAEVWEKLHREETYLTAEECKSLGLIDTILGEETYLTAEECGLIDNILGGTDAGQSKD
jgi:ATP-dependent Clp protease, protease subunit